MPLIDNMNEDNLDIRDDKDYLLYQNKKFKEWENTCTRCGACCGIVEGDPCENMAQDGKGKYFCRIYSSRFGPQKTVSGKPFLCVPIRDILSKSWPGDSCCGYKKNLKALP